MDFDKVSHTLGEVTRRALLGDLHFAPGTMSVEKYEKVDRAVAPILAVIASKSSGRGWNWLAHLADQLGWALVEAHHGPLRVGLFGIEVEDILHAGDIVAIDLGNAPHVLAPRLQLVLDQATAHRLARQAVVPGQFDHRASQQLQGPARPALWRRGAGRRHQCASSFPVSLRVAPGRGSSL